MFITFEQLKKSLETLRDFVFRITPQYTSDLVNDSGFAIKDDIPRSTSDLVNDSGFITVDDIVVPEIAPLFDASTAYAVGDYVIKDATMYRFKTAHAAGAWNASQVDEVTVGSEIKDIK